MSQARTNRRVRKHMKNMYNHLGKIGRPRYCKSTSNVVMAIKKR